MVDLDYAGIESRITHATDNSADLFSATLKEELNGVALNSTTAKAKKLASVTDGAFTGEASKYIDLDYHFSTLKDYQQQLEAAGGKGAFKRMAENQQRTLEKHARNVFRDAGQSIDRWTQAGELAAKQEKTLMERLERTYKSAVRNFEVAAKTEQASLVSAGGTAQEVAEAMEKFQREGMNKLNGNNKAAIDTISTHFRELRQANIDAVTDLKTVVSDIERETNLKFTDYYKSGAAAVEKAAGSEAKALENEVKDVAKASHWKGTAIGGVVGAVGGNLMTSDPDKKGQNTVIGGIAGMLGGNLISRWLKGGLGAKLTPGMVGYEKVAGQLTNAISHGRI